MEAKEEEKSGAAHNAQYECNICLETAREPVTTQCGHLFCWPCLFQWLERSSKGECPVCKAGVTKENVIPLYGRGTSAKEDPRLKSTAVPPRPTGRRPEPPPRQRDGSQIPGFHDAFAPGFTFSAGFGFFPGLFGVHFAPMQAGPAAVQEQSQELALSKLMFIFGIVVLFFVLFV